MRGTPRVAVTLGVPYARRMTYVDEVRRLLAELPPLERARAAHALLTVGRGVLAAVRREAIAQEVAARGRGGVQQVADELGVTRQKVGEALAEHRRAQPSG